MRRIREKLNNKGFTLAELLIVVAIIAVLVAVSIPVFNGKLEKTREATDVANMRAAKAAAVTAYLSEELETDADGSIKDYYYDAEKGILVDTEPTTKYGKGTAIDGGVTFTGYKNVDADGKVIKLQITGPDDSGNKDIEVTMTWE